MMTYATINGKKVYPAEGTSIKLVIENPFMKQQGNHTYQVTFPLDIPENARVFGNMNRIEVSRRVSKYEDCALFSGNKCLLRGSASVLASLLRQASPYRVSAWAITMYGCLVKASKATTQQCRVIPFLGKYSACMCVATGSPEGTSGPHTLPARCSGLHCIGCRQTQ